MSWNLIGNIAFKGEPGKDGENGSDGNNGLTPGISIGQVLTVAAGQPAAASLSGAIEDLRLNLDIPRGADGKNVVLQGGKAELLAPDAQPTVKTRTDAEGKTLIDIGVPAPQKGADGSSGLPASPGLPVKRTLTLGTVYQATDKTKPAQIYVNTDVSFSLSLVNLTPSSEVELRIGPSATGLAAGTSGFGVTRTRLALTGLTALVGMALGTGDQLTAQLPTGWYFVVRVVSGSGVTITSAFDQPLA